MKASLTNAQYSAACSTSAISVGVEPTLYLHFLVHHIDQVGSGRCLGRVLGVDKQIFHQNCLRESWPEENLIGCFQVER